MKQILEENSAFLLIAVFFILIIYIPSLLSRHYVEGEVDSVSLKVDIIS